MGHVPIPIDMTAEQYIETKILHYRYIRYWVIAGVVVLLCAIAAWTYIEKAKTDTVNAQNVNRIEGHITNEINRAVDLLKNPSGEQVLCELERQSDITKKMAFMAYEDGNKAYQNNFFSLAIEHFQKALDLMKIPSFYFALGNSYYVTSNYGAAMVNYNAALSLYEKDFDCKRSERRKFEANTLGNIGLIYSAKGDLDNALKYLQNSKALFVYIGASDQIKIVKRAIDKIQSKTDG